MKNPRAIAARLLTETLSSGKAFETDSLSDFAIDSRDVGLTKEICFGTLRHYFLLDALIKPLLKKPMGKKDGDIYALLLAGLYQLRFMQTPVHAAINSSVDACKELNKLWAKGLVNAVLRNAVRQNLHQTGNPLEEGAISPARKASHPDWLYKQLENDWPEQLEQIVDYNNSPPPMTLRLAPIVDMDSYVEQLTAKGIEASQSPLSKSAITLHKASSVSTIPGFEDGTVSVQDAGAQLAAELLDLQTGQQVLDACAAPGGKSIHALQLAPGIELTALDKQASRLHKLEKDLERCALGAKIIAADASNSKDWWDGEHFDRILLDAPCTGTGIISHHPDIKILRRPKDATQFARQQLKLLNALWGQLKAGGKLLYCTCSILPAENSQVIRQFLEQQPDASLDELSLPAAIDTNNGYQLLPNKGKNGGFFYARLSKSSQL